ncbi:hypothetical protein Tco_0024016 [Tanacetum coccineum]
MTNGREITPPPSFLTLTLIPGPNVNELPPITASTFTAKTPKNTSLTNRASTSANPDPMISSVFVEANYEVLKSLLRERRRQIHNEDLCTQLEYFTEEYEGETEMEPRPAHVRETTLILLTRSPHAQRHKERVVEFEDAPNKDGSRVEMESEGGRPSKRRAEDSRIRGVNLPLPLAAHLGRSENDQPLQSTLTSIFRGHRPLINSGGNLPPNGMHLSHNALPFIPNSLQPANVPISTYVNPYSQPNMGIAYGQPLSYPPHA